MRAGPAAWPRAWTPCERPQCASPAQRHGQTRRVPLERCCLPPGRQQRPPLPLQHFWPLCPTEDVIVWQQQLSAALPGTFCTLARQSEEDSGQIHSWWHAAGWPVRLGAHGEDSLKRRPVTVTAGRTLLAGLRGSVLIARSCSRLADASRTGRAWQGAAAGQDAERGRHACGGCLLLGCLVSLLMQCYAVHGMACASAAVEHAGCCSNAWPGKMRLRAPHRPAEMSLPAAGSAGRAGQRQAAGATCKHDRVQHAPARGQHTQRQRQLAPA